MNALNIFSRVLFSLSAPDAVGVRSRKDWACSKPIQDFLEHFASKIAGVIAIDN
jgi:hypothetical protein